MGESKQMEIEQEIADEENESDIDDSVKYCPECEKPNQFGELCQICEREISEEQNQSQYDPDHLRPDKGGNEASDSYW